MTGENNRRNTPTKEEVEKFRKKWGRALYEIAITQPAWYPGNRWIIHRAKELGVANANLL